MRNEERRSNGKRKGAVVLFILDEAVCLPAMKSKDGRHKIDKRLSRGRYQKVEVAVEVEEANRRRWGCQGGCRVIITKGGVERGVVKSKRGGWRVDQRLVAG